MKMSEIDGLKGKYCRVISKVPEDSGLEGVFYDFGVIKDLDQDNGLISVKTKNGERNNRRKKWVLLFIWGTFRINSEKKYRYFKPLQNEVVQEITHQRQGGFPGNGISVVRVGTGPAKRRIVTPYFWKKQN